MSPGKKRTILLAVIVSLFLGILLAFVLEYLDNTIKIPEDVKQHIKVPYLGPVPLLPLKGNGDLWDDINPELVILHSPKSAASESYRGIRTNILFSSPESAPQVIQISSASPLEGKTITTANLGVTLAQAGGKVIIVDCDMRKPRMHKLFGLANDRGISNLLTGRSDFSETIFHTRIPNLDICPSGPIPPNPSEILGSTRMAAVLNDLRKQYAHILIDSTPSMAITDAVVLSKWVDGLVMVIRAGSVTRELVKNALDRFMTVETHVLGAILNCVDMGRNGYYYYYDYYEEGEKRSKANGKRKFKSLHDGEP